MGLTQKRKRRTTFCWSLDKKEGAGIEMYLFPYINQNGCSKIGGPKKCLEEEFASEIVACLQKSERCC